MILLAIAINTADKLPQVPRTVSYASFWSRYFFKAHALEQSEARRKALLDRLQKKQVTGDVEFGDWVCCCTFMV